MTPLDHKSQNRECIMLSYLAYHNRAEIDTINHGGPLKENTDPCWTELWETMRERYETINIYDCQDYDIGDTQFIYTVDNGGRLIISFRGTKCLSDLITDVRIVKDKCIDICYSPYYLKHYHQGSLPYVHSGFYQMFNIMKLELYHIVRNYLKEPRDTYQILMTGHSLGGSLSIIASACIYVQYHKMIMDGTLKIENITFGSPKVGNSEFCRIYNLWFGTLSRHYFHNCDPIPYVPVLQFYAVSLPIQVNSPDDAGWLYSIEYHFLENYLKYF